MEEIGWDDDWGDEEDVMNDIDSDTPHLRHEKKAALDDSNIATYDLGNNNVEILKRADVQRLCRSSVARVADLLFRSESDAECLLRAFQWNSQGLLNAWLTSADDTLAKIGVEPQENGNAADTMVDESTNGTVTCGTAYCGEVASSDASALDCGHYFCHECWKGFICSQVSSGATCVIMRCMGLHESKVSMESCKRVIPDEFVTRFLRPPFLSDTTLLNKYEQWVLDSFVAGSENTFWCPGKACGRAINTENRKGKMLADITCECGAAVCPRCQGISHRPLPCDLAKKWLHREKSDDATQVWLSARTKTCPSCNVHIEKNKACNHMQCTQCRHEFCWLCKRPWSEHGSKSGGFYVCKAYEEAKGNGKVSAEEQSLIESQKQLQKYTYYSLRYTNGRLSCELTQKQLGSRLAGLLANQSGPDYMDADWLLAIIPDLVAARSVLTWTYVLLYYFRSGAHKELCEHQQQLLMESVESVQDLLERQRLAVLCSMRQDIVNKVNVMNRFRLEMLRYVEQSDKLNDDLLSTADEEMADWGCTACTLANPAHTSRCETCKACRLHGEQDCRTCNRKG